MSNYRVFPVLLFSLLLTTQPFFFPERSFAWMCCPCSYCKITFGCVCPGTPNKCGGFACPPGLTNENGLPVQAPISNEKFDIQRLTHLTKVNECTRLTFSLRVLGDAGQNLKVETFSTTISNTHNNDVQARLMASTER